MVTHRFVMFASAAHVARRQGSKGTPRADYLQQLVSEYQDCERLERRRELVSHLSNFAYDPYNYPALRQLNIVDLFLDAMTDEDSEIREAGAAGLCNVALDPDQQRQVMDKDGIPIIIACLDDANADTIKSALSTIEFLINANNKSRIATRELKEKLDRLAGSPDTHVAKLASFVLSSHYAAS